jgi:hypothetical protein
MRNWKQRTLAAVIAVFGIVVGFIGCDNNTTPEDQIPTTADFDIGNLTQKKNSITAVTITPKTGKTNGAVTVYYNGSAALPAEIGAYAVTFNVAAAKGWKAADGLTAGTFSVYDEIFEGDDAISEFTIFLSTVDTNTKDTPYYISLKVDDLGDVYTTESVIYALISNYTKYVSLDLSGSTITSIGERAFEYCEGLTNITIPNSVTSIGDLAFMEITGLTAINVASDNTEYSSQNGILYDKNKTVLLCYPAGKTETSFIIPNGVKRITEGAFLYCYSLTSVTIPNSVTSIGNLAFYNCGNLTAITIPNSVTSIEDRAFMLCNRLATVTFAGTIPSSGFSNNITLPPFYGDLRAKFYATDAVNGTPGNYTTTVPVNSSSIWTKE